MKKALTSLFAIIMLFTLSFYTIGLTEAIDIDSLSDEELLLLQEKIGKKLNHADMEPEQTNKDRQLEITNENPIVYLGKTLKLQTQITRLTEQAPKTTKIVWKSDNPEIVSVSPEGLIKGVSTGDTLIHAYANDNDAITASVAVSSRASVTSIQIDEPNITLLLGGEKNTDKATIKPIVLPADAFDKSLSFTSSNTKVVEVDSDGNLQAISAGKATITIKSEDKSITSAKTTRCNIIVNQAITSIKVKGKIHTIGVGKTSNIITEIYPSTATQKKLEYKSSNETIASVSANGTITGKSPGSCTITVKATDGSDKEDFCNVVVNRLATSINIDEKPKDIYLIENQTKSFTFSVLPEDATDKSVEWKTSDFYIASVSTKRNTLEIRAVSEGTATITGTAKDGSNKQVSFKVHVEPILSLKYVDVRGYVRWGYHSYTYTFKNVSKSRTIDGLTISFHAEDVYHNKLRNHGFGDYNVEETINITIKPGQTKKTEKVNTYGFDDAKYLYIDVVKVHYTDGTTVENNTSDFDYYFTW